MPTELLGTPLSLGGLVIPAYGVRISGQLSIMGVLAGQVGPVYDFAVGYDLGDGSVDMVGYVVDEKAVWEEGTDLQETQQILQSASPNVTDRDFTRWPKVSQGTWNGGDRQVIFTDPTRYYTSNGSIDTTKPGQLSLLSQGPKTAFTSAIALSGTYNNLPLQTDGDQWYLGLPNGHVIVGKRDGTTQDVTVSSTHEVFDLLPATSTSAGSAGVFVSTNNGIWFLDGSSYAITQWEGTGTFPEGRASPGMALSGSNLAYVAAGGTQIAVVNAAGSTAGTLATAIPPYFGRIVAIATSGTGLIYAAHVDDLPGTQGPLNSALFTCDTAGASPTQVGLIPGTVKYLHTMNGVTYILAHLNEPQGAYNPTLYTWNGSAIQLVDDLRYPPLPYSDFQSSITSLSNYMRGQLWCGGRFLYLAWPGLQTLQYDVSASPVTVQRTGMTGLPGTDVKGHRMVKTQFHFLVDMAWNSTVLGRVRTWNAAPTSGQLITSYFDFTSPTLNKVFKSFELDLADGLPEGASVTVEYQLDSSSNWALMTLNPSSVRRTLMAYFPYGSKGTRVRYRLTLTASTIAVPVVLAYATRATLGRVWKTTASCGRNQQTNASAMDMQGKTAKDLVANIQKASFTAAGQVVLYVPSPASPTMIEQVNAVLEDYTWHGTKVGPRQNERMANDIEGKIDLTFTERP